MECTGYLTLTSKVAAWGSLFIPNSPITYVGKAKEKPPETAAVGMWLITKVKKDGCALRTLLFGKRQINRD